MVEMMMDVDILMLHNCRRGLVHYVDGVLMHWIGVVAVVAVAVVVAVP